MSNIDKAISVLEKRLAFLEQRIEGNPERDLSFDKQEAAALRVAIDVMLECDK